MENPSELRERAARFLALVSSARQMGDVRLTGVLTEMAERLMEQADAAEAGQIIPPRPADPSQPNVQQQQQIPPKDDADSGSLA
jgi:hypothetical protein